MRRFLCLILSLSLIVLGCFIKKNETLFSIIKTFKTDYEILEFEDNNQVVKINNFDLYLICQKLCLEIVNINNLEGRKIIEAYSNKLSQYNVINGRKVNIQISSFDDICIIGYPMIKNSF